MVELAKHFKSDNRDIAIAKINGGVHNETTDKLRIEGYPTLLLIRDVRIWEYIGKKCFEIVVQLECMFMLLVYNFDVS